MRNNLGLWLLCFFSLYCSSFYASGLEITPVRLQLAPQQRIASLHIKNLSDSMFTLESVVKHWQQTNGKNQLRETQDLVVLPPIMRLAPGDEQVLRVLVQHRPKISQESAYRILLQQVLGADDQPGHTLRLALQISLPVFLQAQTESDPPLDWTLTHLRSHRYRLTVHNPANHHVQIQDVLVSQGAQHQQLLDVEDFVYLLPGQRKQWTFKVKKNLSPSLEVTAQTDQGVVHTQLDG